MKAFFGLVFAIFFFGVIYFLFGWIQGGIDSMIPHNENYKFMHFVGLVLHIFILGSLYLWLFVLGIGAIFKSMS